MRTITGPDVGWGSRATIGRARKMAPFTNEDLWGRKIEDYSHASSRGDEIIFACIFDPPLMEIKRANLDNA